MYLRLDTLSTLQENLILQTCLVGELGGIEVGWEVGGGKLRITQNNVSLIHSKLVYSSLDSNKINGEPLYFFLNIGFTGIFRIHCSRQSKFNFVVAKHLKISC